MRTLPTIMTAMFLLILGFAGYYYLDKILPLKSEVEELQRKNDELEFQVDLLDRKNQELSVELEKQVEAISIEKKVEIGQIKTTYKELVVGLQEQIEKGEITITRLADQLSVKIVDRIIFPSGSAVISSDGKKVLQRVGKILKEAEDKRIRVEGHTDNIPIHEKLQNQFPTNWELSVTRATNIVRILQEQVGIAARDLEVAGFGEYKPVASNRTRKGRARNRRIEILLLPKSQKNPNIAKSN